MLNRIEIECRTLEEISRRFRNVGEFYSVFFRSTVSDLGAGFQEVLSSDLLHEAVPRLLPLNESAARKVSVLNKYEFEGSLIGALLQGTCTDRVVADEREAFEAAREIIKCVLLRPDGVMSAFRMDDPSWSALTNAATLSWAYFVHETSQQLWWFVCFADFY
jgi:hypothetical protein